MGERFRFYYNREAPESPHISLHHGTTTETAIRTFLEGEHSQWDPAHARYRTQTAEHVLYWTRHSHDGAVLVISCFERGKRDD